MVISSGATAFGKIELRVWNGILIREWKRRNLYG